MRESTFHLFAPELTVKHVVIATSCVALVTSAGGWIFLGDPIRLPSVLHLMLLSYLWLVQKTTRRALIIASEPAGAVISLVYACYSLGFIYLTLGISSGLYRAGSSLLMVGALVWTVCSSVRSLSNQWDTPIRQIS